VRVIGNYNGKPNAYDEHSMAPSLFIVKFDIVVTGGFIINIQRFNYVTQPLRSVVQPGGHVTLA
jgi:hypothetical protein